MLLAYLVAILINMIIITLGVKLGCMILRHELTWIVGLLIAGITTAISLIPAVGIFLGPIALLISLCTLGEMDFWPESIVVTIAVKAVSIAATIGIFVAMR